MNAETSTLGSESRRGGLQSALPTDGCVAVCGATGVAPCGGGSEDVQGDGCAAARGAAGAAPYDEGSEDARGDEVFVAFRDAGFTYDGERFVFRGLNLRVPQGQFLCLLGGNGSGKSTLAKHINALLVPDEGEVDVFGCDTCDAESTYFIRSNAGLVFQNPDDQLVASLIENDVAFGPENLGIENPELRERVTAALAEVGLQGFEKHETNALSGGQKQRVAIAGVLAMDPAILVLDEATAMLDPRGRAGLLRVARGLHAAGMTVVMITHFMEEAVAAERVVVLDGGAVRLDGTPEEVLTRADELRELSLEVPFACRLSLKLQERGVPVRTCIAEDELKEELCALRSKK